MNIVYPDGSRKELIIDDVSEYLDNGDYFIYRFLSKKGYDWALYQVDGFEYAKYDPAPDHKHFMFAKCLGAIGAGFNSIGKIIKISVRDARNGYHSTCYKGHHKLILEILKG